MRFNLPLLLGTAYWGASDASYLFGRIEEFDDNLKILVESVGTMGDRVARGELAVRDIPHQGQLCGELTRNPINVIRYVNTMLFEVGIAGGPIESVTPFANLHRLCGRLDPVFKQTILSQIALRGAVERNPFIVTLDSGNDDNTLRHIYHAKPDNLILGGISKRALTNLLLSIIGEGDEPLDVLETTSSSEYDLRRDFSRSNLITPHIQRAVGRVFGLAVINSVPTGIRLSTRLLDGLLGNRPDRYYEHVRNGFRDIVPSIPITADELGIILTGVVLIPRIESLRTAFTTRDPLNGRVLPWFWRYFKDEPSGRTDLLYIMTGLRFLPIGGIRVIAPAMGIEVVPFNQNDPFPRLKHHTLYLPAYDTEGELGRYLDRWLSRMPL